MAISRIFNVAAAGAMLASSAAASAQPLPCPGAPGAGLSVSALGSTGPNLLLDENFPDPFVARFGGNFYAYATGSQSGGRQMNVQVVRSHTLTGWTVPTEALPAEGLPKWVDKKHPQVWAPEVMRVGSRFLLYFNARHAILTRTERPPEGPRVLQRHCLGVAVANRAHGPFKGIDTPLVCSEFPDGVIDASPFRDGNRLYVYFKDDGNCCGRGSGIYVQQLSADGLTALGSARRLIANNDEPGKHDDWEWQVVEAPTMVKHAGSFYLFYSGNFFGNKNYSVAYLNCEAPRGPCRDPGENPILWSHRETPLAGPGHQSILHHRGRSYVFFHGWNKDPDARERFGVHKRCLYVSRLRWLPGPGGKPRPVIAGGEPQGETGQAAQ